MKKRLWGALGAALLALSGTSVSGASAQATEVPPTAKATSAAGWASVAATPPPGTNLQVMSWNMCGVERWGCTGTGTAAEKADVVKQYVQSHYVQAVLLQEVCTSGLDDLMTKLGAGWSKSFAPYHWSQKGVRTASPCATGAGSDPNDLVGTAIVVKAGLADAQQYPTTQPWTGLNPPFQCATATYFGVRLCNVHVSTKNANPEHPDWDYRDDQLAEIQRVVSGFPKVAFAGDFNASPPDRAGNPDAWIWPAGLYSQGPGTPGYQECDQQGAVRDGRDTHDGGWKLDYLFSSEARRWCLVADTPRSDHHVLIESVTITPPAA
ncbi:endonuclease/exonuclease/phosphatase family protein [Streptomyces sp. NPDC046182]|uniref:endonuclease/exonuclease/phosphatase family protein n=1 Tax=Streptomyces sp. NPDC046182 TaxID=3154601 RepID=UPI0034027712